MLNNPLTNSSYQLIKRQSCHHIETSQLICRANQLTGFYMMTTLAFNELSWLYLNPSLPAEIAPLPHFFYSLQHISISLTHKKEGDTISN